MFSQNKNLNPIDWVVIRTNPKMVQKCFWVLTAECELYQDFATDIDTMMSRFRKPDQGSPIDCQYCVLPEKRVYMVYWTGHVNRALNAAATRILVDQFLLDTPTPSYRPDYNTILQPAADPATEEMQRALRFCPHGKAVFFKIDTDEALCDYPAKDIRLDWHRFFRSGHPSTIKQNSAYLSRVGYACLCQDSIIKEIAVNMLLEPFFNNMCQKQRVETVLLGHYLFSLNPATWLKLNDFDAVVRVFTRCANE